MSAKENKQVPQAAKAIYAAKLRQTIGSYAARRYAVKNGVLRLYTLACQLSAIERSSYDSSYTTDNHLTH